MDIQPVGKPLQHAAMHAASKHASHDPPVQEPAPDTPPQDEVSAEQTRAERTRADLERLADDVLSIFDEAPDSLERLVATLKRLEASKSP